jgi:hypothetical protein
VSKMLESTFWALLKPHLPGYSERIENLVSTGTPDVYNCTDGVSTWLELKSLAKLAHLDNLKLGLHESQRIWHIRYRRHGGRVFILTRVDNDLYVHQYDLSGFTRIFMTTKPFDWENLIKNIIKTTVFTNTTPGL